MSELEVRTIWTPHVSVGPVDEKTLGALAPASELQLQVVPYIGSSFFIPQVVRTESEIANYSAVKAGTFGDSLDLREAHFVDALARSFSQAIHEARARWR